MVNIYRKWLIRKKSITFSEKELRIIDYFVNTNKIRKDIAISLELTLMQVNKGIENIYYKTNTHNRIGFILWWKNFTE